MLTAGHHVAARAPASGRQAWGSSSALDAQPERAFDDLAAAAAHIAGMPMGIVSLLDEDHFWVTAKVGTDVRQMDREVAFCGLTVALQAELIAPDTLLDPRFADHPLVTGAPYVRSYAGFPLRAPDGLVIGTLCVLGPHPTSLDEDQLRLLRVLAKQVMKQLELRRESARRAELFEQLALSEHHYRQLAELASDIISRHAPDGTVLYVSPSLQTVLGYDPVAEIGQCAPDRVHPEDLTVVQHAVMEVAAGRGPITVTGRTRHADGSWRWMETTLSVLPATGSAGLELHSCSRDVTARVLADQACRESEVRYRELVERAPDAIIVHVQDKIVFANAAAARLFGARDPAELLGRDLTEHAEPTARALVTERRGILLAGGAVPILRTSVRSRDGRWTTVDGSGSRVLVNGRIGVQNVLRDVTEQAEAADAIFRSEQEHRALFEQSPVGLVETDIDGRISRANSAFALLVGRPVTDLNNLLMSELADPAHRTDPADRISVRIRAGEVAPRVDRIFLRPDGERVQASLSSAAVRGNDGGVERILVTVVDMTERNLASQKLQRLVAELGLARAEADQRTALLDAVLDTIDVGVVACDAGGRLTLFNRATRDFHGVPEDPNTDQAGWSAHDGLRTEDGVCLLEPDQVPLYRALVEGHVSNSHITISPAGKPARVLRCDGRALYDADGRVTGAVVAMKDVTDLRASEQRFRSAFQDGPTPMARLDNDGTVRDANPALRRFLSVSTSRLVGHRLHDLVHPDDQGLLSLALSGAGTGANPVEVRLLRQDGVAVWCELATTVSNEPTGTAYVLAQLLDVHERKNHEFALEQAAIHDPLTGLGNRQVLVRALERCLKAGSGATVLFVDLDDFKRVNDSFGHDVGDRVLVETAARLQACLRPQDTVTRIGGDEFVAVCLSSGVQTEAALARRVELALARPISHNGTVITVGASVGSAVGLAGEDPAALVSRADQAMYRRKQQRRT